jgi:hypothetical protein
LTIKMTIIVFILHPTPYALHPATHNPHSTLYILHLTPYPEGAGGSVGKGKVPSPRLTIKCLTMK